MLRAGELETSECEPLSVTLAAASAGEGPRVRGTQAELSAVKREALLQKMLKGQCPSIFTIESQYRS